MESCEGLYSRTGLLPLRSYLEVWICPGAVRLGAAAARLLLGRHEGRSLLPISFHLKTPGQPCDPPESLVTPGGENSPTSTAGQVSTRAVTL